MSWRDQLRPASFRGVAFDVEADRAPVGRRVVVHTYPQRDKTYPEDMGRCTREYRMTGYVIGPDCFERRDALLTALETAGAGELIHPWLGTLSVQPGECEMAHERREGGMVRFALTFHEAHAPSYPNGAANTAHQTADSSTGLLDTALDRYQQAVDTIDRTQLAVDRIQAQGEVIYGTLARYAGPLADRLGGPQDFTNRLVSDPSAFGHAVGAVMGRGTDAFDPFDGYAGTNSRVHDRLDALAALNALHRPSGRAAQQLIAAAAALAQDALWVDTTRMIAQLPVQVPVRIPVTSSALDVQAVTRAEPVEVPVTDDALALSQAVSDAIWAQGLEVPRAHFQALTAVRIRITRHLAAVAREGVGLVFAQLPEPLPALVLAYARYGDATRADEIVMRNRVIHPGFVPPGEVQVLAR